MQHREEQPLDLFLSAPFKLLMEGEKAKELRIQQAIIDNGYIMKFIYNKK
jgi:hypothetical protein